MDPGMSIVPNLNTNDLILRLSGSGKIECTQATARSVKLVLEGSGNIECEADIEDLYSQIDGSGEIKIIGSALNSEIRVIGSGHQRARSAEYGGVYNLYQRIRNN